MNENQKKAIKALEAAVRKCGREGIEVRTTYTYEFENGGKITVTINEETA